MKKQLKNILWILAGIAIILVLTGSTVEYFRSRTPNYCTSDNSCLGQGCSLDPSDQPCDRNRTTTMTINQTDMDWGDLLGGQSVEVCADQNGAMMNSNVCSECSVCGLLVPPSGNLSGGLCVPLTAKGCMKNAPGPKLLEYLNGMPESISCCGN
jgi:hypothetical protein